MGFFDTIKDGFSKAAGAVKSAASAAFDKGKSVATGVYNPIKKLFGTVYNDAKSAVSWAAVSGKEMASQIVNMPKELANSASDFGKSAVSSLAMPLIIGAAVIGGIFLISKMNSGSPYGPRYAGVSVGVPGGLSLGVGRNL